MDKTLKLRIGLYGLVFHLLLSVVLLLMGRSRGADIGADVYAMVLPSMYVAAFVSYFFVVSPYVAKRKGLRGLVLYDSLVGMLAECIIVGLTVVLYSVIASIPLLGRGGVMDFLEGFGINTIIYMLYAYATFMVHILIFGNMAGLIGWYVLKKTRAGAE